MFEQSLKNIDDSLHRDPGCATELDYIEQTSWILFLKYLNDLEKDKDTEAKLANKTYKYIVDPKYRWDVWACPKTSDGKIDHQKALSGDDLKNFVDGELFPYLKKFKYSAENADTIEYKIGEIFSELKNKIQTGYTLRDILNVVDNLEFRTDAEKHELSHLYESKLQNMGNAGRNGGEFYTPRALIRAIVRVVDPKLGQTIYDGAVGSAGFLVESFNYLTKEREKLSPKEWEILQTKTFYGQEVKSLAYIIGVMNMILHGIDAPNIIHTDTLNKNISDIQEKERYDIILTNPPFGSGIKKQIQQNFPIRTGESAYLFLQHFIKILKAGGKAGVVIKNTFLSNTDNASVSLRKHLLETCNLHTILDLPSGVFTGAGVKTVVLFFEKGSPTKKIWYYQLNLERNLGKTTALTEQDLDEFVELQRTKANSDNSWSVDINDVDQKTLDLSVKNPNGGDAPTLKDPKEILEEMKKLDKESNEILNRISERINEK